MAWNAEYRNVLASASADGSVRVWDLEHAASVAALEDLHKDKVQDVAWNPGQPNILLSGGFDRRVAVADARSGAALVQCRVDSDVECVAWDPSGRMVATIVAQPIEGAYFKFTMDNGYKLCHLLQCARIR